MERPMYMNLRPKKEIKAQTGKKLQCKNWDTEAALRMLRNNLHPEVALDWQKLIVYGGQGRAARNWKEYHKIVRALKSLGDEETLCIQSGKAVYIAPTHKEAPRVVIANSNIVPKWATQENFDKYDRMGLIMYGQMTAGSWIYIGTQGILQGTYETLTALARKEFGEDSLRGKFVLTAGMGAMSGAQPMAVTMNEGVLLCVEARSERIQKKINEGYCDKLAPNLGEAIRMVDEAISKGVALSIGLVGNAADVYPKLVARGVIPDVVTDQTSAHDLLSYVPEGDLWELAILRRANPDEYKLRAQESIAKHAGAILDMQEMGAVC